MGIFDEDVFLKWEPKEFLYKEIYFDLEKSSEDGVDFSHQYIIDGITFDIDRKQSDGIGSKIFIRRRWVDKDGRKRNETHSINDMFWFFRVKFQNRRYELREFVKDLLNTDKIPD